MRRSITEHSLGVLNERLTIEAMDEAVDGGASTHYLIKIPSAPGAYQMEQELKFQNGTLVVGSQPNGVSNEAVLAVLIDRLRGFQSGRFASQENANALSALEDGLHWLQERTKKRVSAGVEGTHEPIPAAEVPPHSAENPA